MKLIEALCLSAGARALFEGIHSRFMPRAGAGWVDRWFNWRFRTADAPDEVVLSRVETLARPDALQDWADRCRHFGYAPRLVSLVGEGLSVGGVPHAALDPGDEMHAWQLGLALSEPDGWFLRGWTRILLGGGVPFRGPEGADPRQWRAYGEALAAWFVDPSNRAQLKDRYPDFMAWPGDEHQPLQLPAGDFDWPQAGRPYYPGTADFIAHRQMPCCGVELRADGKPGVVGLLPSSWAFDAEETVRSRLAACGSEARKFVDFMARLEVSKLPLNPDEAVPMPESPERASVLRESAEHRPLSWNVHVHIPDADGAVTSEPVLLTVSRELLSVTGNKLNLKFRCVADTRAMAGRRLSVAIKPQGAMPSDTRTLPADNTRPIFLQAPRGRPCELMLRVLGAAGDEP